MLQSRSLFSSHWRRAAFALFIVTAVVVAATGAADRLGLRFLEGGMKRALVTFGISRTLNGVISVAQGTEVAIEPAGVGVNFAPGEILDPVNDLVERFSWVMLTASASLGLQKLLLELFEWTPVTLAYAASGLVLLVLIFLHQRIASGVLAFFVRLFVMLTIVRFMLPLLALTAEAIHDGFLQTRYDAAIVSLEQSGTDIGKLNRQGLAATEAEAPEGFLDTLGNLIGSARSGFDLESRFQQYREVAGEVATTSIELIVIFLFQTIVLPLVMLYLGKFLFTSTMRMLRGFRASA
jgi:hypothetical protein